MPSPPFKVKAVYEYTSPHDDDLHFPNGQIITVTEEEDEDWYVGEYVDATGVKQEGIFPRNFVENYEPTAPPRPNRASRVPKKEPEPEPVLMAQPDREPEHEEVENAPAAPIQQAVTSPLPNAAEFFPPPAAPKPAPASPKPSATPPVSDKPSGGSFRDRIAAFNKAAPPPAPFKPGSLGSGSSNFVKKPFVAPPPSKNSYVPVPREVPLQKIYRRDEVPEITAKESENLEQADKAGLAPSSNVANDEDQPKPTSLKERIALLQKQQMEQAARHAEAAQKKEKPKKPSKKRTESHGQEAPEDEDGGTLERRDTEETVGTPSIDSAREEPDVPRRRKSSRAAPSTPGIQPRQSFGDGNEADMSGAGDTTEEPEEMSTGRDDSDDKAKSRAPLPPGRAATAPAVQPDVGEEEGAAEEPAGEDDEEEGEEEEDVDPEVRRKEELRARMAKMSGGMGMHGMFGGGMPMAGMAPPKKKKSTGSGVEKRSGEYGVDDIPSTARAPPVPMIPMPGISHVQTPDQINRRLENNDEIAPISSTRPADEVPDVEEVVPSQEREAPPPIPYREGGAPPIQGGRPAPPPVPKESRPVAPVPQPMSPSAGSESDDDLSVHAQNLTPNFTGEASRAPPRTFEMPGSPRSPNAKRVSYFGSEASPSSPSTPGTSNNKRTSRLPPPIPGAATVSTPQNRAPPPPPPAAATLLARSPSSDEDTESPPSHLDQEESYEEEVTEYEGDYDTDIASAAPHKEALKAHARESSLDDSTPNRSPIVLPTSAPPPLPPVTAPRAVPPPLPSQPPSNSRHSSEMPRAAPPPPPPPGKMPAPWEQDDDEYDPYKYTAALQGAPSLGVSTSKLERKEEDLYAASPPRLAAPLLHERAAPPPPPRDQAPQQANRSASRQSIDVLRSATSGAKRSVELSRMSMDSGYVANDVDLAQNTLWWTKPHGLPPIFQNRKDVLYESEESTSSKRGGKTTVTKDLYVLFQDYSQTVITAQFDAQDPTDAKLDQRHEPPPSRLRQDQLEQAYEQFGRRIADAMTSKKEAIVGDGTPQGLIQELLKPFADALLPIGTRAYGAIVYGNLANASTQQNDEIRPGDIITLRNTKFQGKHGPMHAKYSMEVGKPDHVGVVAEWDGTKKKVRAWEQGRESKKLKMESFKLDDLRSGEVKIWRVMPRSWVGWQGQN